MKTKDITLCALVAAIISVLAQIAIPLPGGVPFTLQIIGVIIAGIILGPKQGTIAVIIYVILGIIGLPVFANQTGGLQIVLGPTGGFILSFPIIAFVSGLFANVKHHYLFILIGVVIGAMLNYLIGTYQFMMVTGSDFVSGLTVCVAPFIVLDIIKWMVSVLIGLRVKHHIRIQGVLRP